MTANSVWTIQRILQWTTQYFKIHHIEEARLDAELLLAHVLKKTRKGPAFFQCRPAPAARRCHRNQSPDTR